MLEMRPICERCNALLSIDSNAYICSYECTFCKACSEELNHQCPNCQGELRPRPRRIINSNISNQ